MSYRTDDYAEYGNIANGSLAVKIDLARLRR
jgi:hypothetical protein